MAKKLFVGGISFKSTDDQLRDLFAQQGTVVSAAILKDRETGRSRGFGFVEMATDEEAQNAINNLNGTDFDGRKINVSEAREMADRGDRGGSGDRRPRRNNF